MKLLLHELAKLWRRDVSSVLNAASEEVQGGDESPDGGISNIYLYQRVSGPPLHDRSASVLARH